MTKAPTMFEEFSFSGYWWLPGDEENRCAGTATFSPETGIELELLDAPDAPSGAYVFMGEVKEEPYLVMSVNNQLTGEQGTTTRQSQSEHKRYRAEYLLAKRWYHPDKTTPISLKSASATFSSLLGWVWPESPFSKDFGSPEDKKITITYDLDRPLQEFHVTNIESEISVYVRAGQNPGPLSEIKLETYEGISIKPKTPQSLVWFRDQIDSIRDLLTFLSGMPMENKFISGVLNEDEDLPESIRIYHFVRPPRIDTYYNSRMAFPLQRLSSQVQNVFQAWFNRNENARVPYNHCLDVIRNVHWSLKDEFLTLTRAVESYYQAKNPKVYQPSPRRFFTSLRRQLPIELRKELGLDKKYQRVLIVTRNYYTHYDPKKRKRALKGAELYDAISRLVVFIAYFLYFELDIPKETTLESIGKSKYYGLWQRPIPESQEPEQSGKQPANK